MSLSFLSEISKVTEHLFISAANAVKPDKVREYGITCIINCTVDSPLLNMPLVETMRISIDDLPTANISTHFEKCVDKIAETKARGGKTLVHCMAGVSRSASIVLAYLMKYQNMTLRDAYHLLKARRPIIQPNVGFFRQLMDYEKRLFGKGTVHLVSSAAGAIPDVYRNDSRGGFLLFGVRQGIGF